MTKNIAYFIRIRPNARDLFDHPHRGSGWNARIKTENGSIFIKPSSRPAPPSGIVHHLFESFTQIDRVSGIGTFDSYLPFKTGKFNWVTANHGWYQLVEDPNGAIELNPMPEMVWSPEKTEIGILRV